MSSEFTTQFDHLDAAMAQPFGDGYVGFDADQQFGSTPNFGETESVVHSKSSPPLINTLADQNGPILPEMITEEGVVLREWRRQNAARLEEKELREKHLLTQILEEADVYKIEFHKKRQVACETNKVMNREMETAFVSSLEKFHAEADKDYWKSVAELIPNEVPVLEKKGKEKEKKPSIAIMHGPKPGKPTDLSRMRQTLVKLKHATPAHLKPLFHAASAATADDVKVDPVASPKDAEREISTQPIIVA
ncbi:vesicle coat protein [Lithospermum erythrorhizon]|uniref:Clathrin light chain n=1 Tax=Lithospermum erythrorhizon TaxID=34254 RepID=A0AAV3Q7Y7_LITER